MKRFGLGWFAVVVVGVGVAAGQVSTDPTHRDEAAMNGAPAGSAKRPMTFADLMAMKRVSDPQISPSGKWVLFGVTDVDLGKNTKVNHLWVVAIDGSAPERQVTSNTGESFGRFSPDGKFVSYTGEPTKDDPVERITIATWDEKTGSIGAGRTLQAVSGDADGAVWSPDSKHFLFTTEVWPECSVRGGSDPTRDDKTVTNGAPDVVVGGTRDVAAWKGMEPAGWADEDACDKAKDEAVAATPVKGQEWDGLLYRHWDHWTGQKRTHILVVNADGTGVRDLTPASAVGDAETPTFSMGGPLGYAWAPDSKEIAYVTNLDAVPAASTNNDVFTLRLDEAGAKAVKVSTSPGSDDEPEYSPDGKWLAFRSQARGGFESDRFRLMVMDRGELGRGQVGKPAVSGQRSAVSELMPKFDRWVDEFTWAPDSGSLYFAAGESGTEQIFQFSTVDKTLSVRTAGVRGDESRDADLARDLGHSQGAEYSSLVTSSNGQWLVASMMSARAPAEVVALQVDDREEYDDTETHIARRPFDGPTSIRNVIFHEHRISHINDAGLRQLELPPMEDFWFTGAEGTKVEGFLLKPPGFDPKKKYPVKFLMHGGPQTAWGDAWSYRWNWELMAASGYVVVGINRRGSTGYGQKFVDEVSGDWGGRAYEDLMKGLDYAESKFPSIDKTRECALGASYGGFMADWVLTHTNRFQCIVTHDGMYDPVSAYGSTEEMWFNEWEFRRPEDFPKGWDGFTSQQSKIAGSPGFSPQRAKLAGSPGTKTSGYDPMGHPTYPTRDDKAVANGAPGSVAGHAAEPWRYQNLPADEDPFRRWSPARFIENAKTPTLVIHSQLDMRLDVSQGFELFTALQRLGVPSKMLYFPDESHWVLKPRNAELWNAEVSDWCDRWTKTNAYAGK